MPLFDQLGLRLPIIQAPMAGVSTPELAAAVSNSGALGSVAVGAADASSAEAMIEDLQRLTEKPFNVNVFVHETPRRDRTHEDEWLRALAPLFAEMGAEPLSSLRTIYRSFNDDEEMLRLLVDRAPPVVSFHFGLPGEAQIRALKSAGSRLIATATNLDEAVAARRAGMDAIVAQGFEAGGHRGVFDPKGDDPQLGAMALTRLLVSKADLPVIAAGGIMDGRGFRAALDLGAIGAQLGTAFIACPESAADEVYRAALDSDAAKHTVMTEAISGRPARCLRNRFTDFGLTVGSSAPAYPVAYDAGKALNAAARARGDGRFGAHWAGQGAPLCRKLPARELVASLEREMRPRAEEEWARSVSDEASVPTP